MRKNIKHVLLFLFFVMICVSVMLASRVQAEKVRLHEIYLKQKQYKLERQQEELEIQRALEFEKQIKIAKERAYFKQLQDEQEEAIKELEVQAFKSLGDSLNAGHAALAKVRTRVQIEKKLQKKKFLNRRTYVHPKRRLTWVKITQEERNHRIMLQAEHDVSQPDRIRCKGVNSNCKKYIFELISNASGGVAKVPFTYPNAYGWKWYENEFAKEVESQEISNARPGQIVQMNYNVYENGRRLPHTFTIVKNDLKKKLIWVVENARRKPPDKSTYCLRRISIKWSEFEKRTSGRYTIYHMTGGRETEIHMAKKKIREHKEIFQQNSANTKEYELVYSTLLDSSI